MKIDRLKFQKALEIVKPGLATKELIEQSTSFAFTQGRVFTYNDEISVSHPIEGLELEGAIQANELYEFLNKVKTDEVEYEQKGSEIVFSAKRSRAGFTLQSEIKLPLKEEIGEIDDWKKLPERFLSHIDFVIGACANDMSRPILTCIHVNKEGIIEGSDNHRLARCTLGEKMPVNTFLFPASVCPDIRKINPIHISMGKGWVHFKNEQETILSCRIYLGEEYPKTEHLLNVQGVKVTLPKTAREMLERAMVFSKRKFILDESVTVTIDNNRLKMEAKSEYGWFEEEVNMLYEGEKIQFVVAPCLMKDILEKTDECTIRNDNRMLLFEKDDWKYVTALKMLNK